ncbi:MAG: PorP/SprF family type IX secretion system membrane protein [Cyclobacteriaceae bacterium]|nr:PorP/SprF family type IX secretion system membrane protein [Cyclobacteriaceae bacterium]
MLTFRFVFFLLTVVGSAKAQYFQFSQYNFASQRVNPAMVASSNYASAGFVYRNQATGGDFNLNSTIISAAYPFLQSRSGKRWSGIGVSILDDRSGNAGIYTTQEASLSYAVNIFISRYQTLSLGVKGLYQQQKINMNGLFTGSQYIPDRGFDDALNSGENMELLRTNFFTFSTGLYWQQTDRNQNKLAYLGISIFDFNKPQDSFMGSTSQLNSTGVLVGGFRAFSQNRVAVFPEALLTHSASNTVLNFGAITRYTLPMHPNQTAAHVDVITKYVPGRSGILGLQLHRSSISVGFSYDFPVFMENAGNQGAFEFGLELRSLVDPRMKKRKEALRKAAQKKASTPVSAKERMDSNDLPKASAVKKSTSSGDTTTVKKQSSQLRSTLQSKQDSVQALAEAGIISHEPFVLEKVTLYFNFEFNSAALDDASEDYLQELGSALKDNALLKIKLTGHTDNIGSDRFNLRLSLYRAEAIKEHLVKQGIDPSRVETEGKGMREPIVENDTEEKRAKNRRVELIIFYAND